MFIYNEEAGDLFTVDKEYALVHCISKDCAMGAGIAKEFVKKFPDLRNETKRRVDKFTHPETIGFCILICIGEFKTGRHIFNLITKQKAHNKPTYETLRNSLIYLRNNYPLYTKLAMPKIGCGLDGLEWEQVREIIKNVFKDTDCEILIKTN